MIFFKKSTPLATSLFFFAILLLSLISASSVHAGICDSDPEYFGVFESGIKDGTICSFINANGEGSLVAFIQLIISLVTALIVGIGLISIVIGGYFYMTAGGSADRIGTAKNLIVSAILGIILALTSWLILNTISGQFTDPQIPLPSPTRDPGYDFN